MNSRKEFDTAGDILQFAIIYCVSALLCFQIQGSVLLVFCIKNLPGIWIDVNRSKIDAKSLIISDEVGSDLCSVGVGIESGSRRGRGTIEAFKSDLHQMFGV